MAGLRIGWGSVLLVLALVLVVLPDKAAAFGAGNIPSIAQVEGHNWRHGDIEDVLKTLAFINGKKWTTMMVGRTYFGNWLRDYSQAIDVGSLKGVNAATIRILVSLLSQLRFSSHPLTVVARFGSFPSWPTDTLPKSSRLPRSVWAFTDPRNTSTTLLATLMERTPASMTQGYEDRLTPESSRSMNGPA